MWGIGVGYTWGIVLERGVRVSEVVSESAGKSDSVSVSSHGVWRIWSVRACVEWHVTEDKET